MPQECVDRQGMAHCWWQFHSIPPLLRELLENLKTKKLEILVENNQEAMAKIIAARKRAVIPSQQK